MKRFECSPATPWGIHPQIRNDEDCPRCGWTAPGPMAGARGDAARAAAAHGWAVIHGGAAPLAAPEPDTRAA
ncbi:MAG TPA: hypothetical protein VD887_11780 [Allosphingosinicella sp.]|nr:hypothetical protein [Allosphingosinicella sp.]